MLPQYLFHVTPISNLPSIQKEGLRPGAYLSALADLTKYYAETVKDEGEVPVIIKIPFDRLDVAALEPDYPGIEEPILTIIRPNLNVGNECDEDWIYGRWVESEQDFQASLELIGSVRYSAHIPVKILDIESLKTKAPDDDYEPGF